MVVQEILSIKTQGRGTYDISGDVAKVVGSSGIRRGLCNVFIQHTSASLMLCENADPTVRRDLEAFMSRIVPDGDPLFQHTTEGPDDMPAHIRSVLTHSEVTLPVSGGRCILGTWQGIYVWEHRRQPNLRRITITVYGE
ncbi:MAG: secondary thiamine-phosphate synthase enzyme YjbQ [Gammaproteobacteria bacterium]|nr:secondary thiamine-phosphate synthase enzyme YjbQ [Gammaproteobacteria bacterium]MCI0591279.1 secondary thiamine-phosphate synthase enzyme YjbQ [Gammaproteobacteria bacterium]